MSPKQRRSTTARRPNSTRRQFLQMEPLEDRAVLTGNVFASAAGGYLTLIGDAGDNQVEITRVGTSSVSVTSLDGTTNINGSASTKTFTNVTNGIIAVTGSGDDVLELSGSSTDILRLYGNTSINTGEGNDIVRFTNFSSWGSLAVLTGGGDDQIYSQLDAEALDITLGGLRVGGPAVINAGAGNDLISLRNSTFQSNALIDGSLGNDTIDLRATSFQRITSIYGGLGVDSLNSVANTFRYNPFIFQLETQTSVSGPSASNDTATVAENGTVSISVLDNDTATSGTINTGSVALVAQPLHGTATVNQDGTITYANNGAEFATDTFTYTVLDSSNNISNVATVLVTVTPVNDLPVAVNDTLTVNEGAAATLNLATNDTDAEGQLNRNSIIIVTQPANGSVTVGTNGNVTYTSNGNEVTSDSFTYTIADSSGGVSAVGTVNVVVNPLNDAPTIGTIGNVSTNEDTATGAIAVIVNDAETAAASLNVTATSSNTTLVPNASIVVGGSGSNRTVTITPAANASGTSTITVKVTDAANVTTTQTFVLTVNAVNDAPTITAVADTTVNEDTATSTIAFTIGDQETAATGLTVTATSSDPTVVANTGIAISGTGANRTVTVTPVANAAGSSTITLNVSDGTTTTQETFLITVNPVNDLPTITAIADTTVAAGTTIAPIAITIGDVETAATALMITGSSSNDAVIPYSGVQITGTGAARTVVLTPVANATGTTTITVHVADANGGFVDETFNVTINAAPTISAIADTTINEDANTGALAFTVGDTETAAGNLTLSATSSNTALVPVANVTFGGSGASRTVLVTPVANASGSTTINVTVTDANGLTSAEQFVVNVTEVNDLPTLSTIANVNVNEDAAIAPITVNVGDVETPLSNLTVTATSNNQALIANSGINVTTTGGVRTITLTQVANASGTATINVQVADANSGITTQTFNVNVAAVNDIPVAGNASATVLEGGSVLIDLGAVSSDVEGQLNLTSGITITQQPTRGMLTLNGDGTVTYTHNDSETTSDSFKYTIKDAQGAASAQATVNLTVTPVNDAPTANPDTAALNFVANSHTAVSVSGNVLSNDTDVDTNVALLSVAGTTAGDTGTTIQMSYGTFTIAASGAWTYTIDPAALDQIMAGTDLPELIGYEVSDGTDSGFGLLSLNIHVI